jgi:hypothetical protein
MEDQSTGTHTETSSCFVITRLPGSLTLFCSYLERQDVMLHVFASLGAVLPKPLTHGTNWVLLRPFSSDCLDLLTTFRTFIIKFLCFMLLFQQSGASQWIVLGTVVGEGRGKIFLWSWASSKSERGERGVNVREIIPKKGPCIIIPTDRTVYAPSTTSPQLSNINPTHCPYLQQGLNHHKDIRLRSRWRNRVYSLYWLIDWLIDISNVLIKDPLGLRGRVALLVYGA